MQFTHCAVAIGAGHVIQYLNGPYTLKELMEPEPGINQEITIYTEDHDGVYVDEIVAVWIPEWATWEVWYN